MSYFNERIAVWEPLLEPVPKSEFRYRRWRLGAIVKQHKIEKQKATPFAIPETIAEDEETDGNAVVKTSDSGVDLSARRESVAEVEMPPPAIAVTISSDDPLELTVTKTALYVIQRLVKVSLIHPFCRRCHSSNTRLPFINRRGLERRKILISFRLQRACRRI